MIRKSLLAALLTLGLGTAVPTAAPIKLARHPDIHGTKIVFSYLGDIWMANDDGTSVLRVTDNTAREIYPRIESFVSNSGGARRRRGSISQRLSERSDPPRCAR